MTHTDWLERYQAAASKGLQAINTHLGYDRVGEAKDVLEKLNVEIDHLWQLRLSTAQQEVNP